ncbi:MAG: hypothetical protein IPG53_15150 [Ignavibacteriales bacterium]|nr:hypothetical protein [Ignavibacteriales bacterium]
MISNISVKYFHQLIVRDAEVVMPTARLLPAADHTSDGIQLTSNWVFSPNYRFVFGLDAWQREMDSKRQRILNAKRIRLSMKDPFHFLNLKYGLLLPK